MAQSAPTTPPVPPRAGPARSPGSTLVGVILPFTITWTWWFLLLGSAGHPASDVFEGLRDRARDHYVVAGLLNFFWIGLAGALLFHFKQSRTFQGLLIGTGVLVLLASACGVILLFVDQLLT